MTRQMWVFLLCGVLAVALFAFAFVAAPSACEWGLNAYFWSGVAVFFVLLVAPILLRTDLAISRRILHGTGFAVVGLVVWLAGLLVADVQIMCRLF